MDSQRHVCRARQGRRPLTHTAPRPTGRAAASLVSGPVPKGAGSGFMKRQHPIMDGYEPIATAFRLVIVLLACLAVCSVLSVIERLCK